MRAPCVRVIDGGWWVGGVCVWRWCSPVDLLPGGGEKRLTFDNRLEFVDLATAMRLHEFDAAVAAIRRGILSLVPERALRWFMWREMEVLVCAACSLAGHTPTHTQTPTHAHTLACARLCLRGVSAAAPCPRFDRCVVTHTLTWTSWSPRRRTRAGTATQSGYVPCLRHRADRSTPAGLSAAVCSCATPGATLLACVSYAVQRRSVAVHSVCVGACSPTPARALDDALQGHAQVGWRQPAADCAHVFLSGTVCTATNGVVVVVCNVHGGLAVLLAVLLADRAARVQH